MKWIFANACNFLKVAVVPLFLSAFLTTSRAVPLLDEHFDQDVSDNSPIGSAHGWNVRALHDGLVTDFSLSTPGPTYPSISHTLGFSGVHGSGYLVLGSGNVVSNVLVWLESGTNFHGHPVNEISFYTKNDAASSRERVVVWMGGRWYASTMSFHDTGGNSAWTLNTFAFSKAPDAWRILNTNTLTLGAPITTPLPGGDISAVGVFSQSDGAFRIRLDEFQVLAGPQMDPTYLVGSWLWAQQTSGRQTCRFWKSIEIPPGSSISKARLRLTADNSYLAFFDGIEFGRGSEWRRLTEFDLTQVLTPGIHVLAVEAFNEWGAAGFVAGVTVEFGDGRVMEIPSDGTWRIVPGDQKGWKTRKSPSEDWPAAHPVYRFRDYPGLPEHPQVLFPSPLKPVVVKFWQTGWFQITLFSFCVVVVGICLHLLGRLALQSRSQQVLQRERARIARDIHDDFGAGLTQLVLLGEMVQKDAVAGSEAHNEFAKVSETGRRLLTSIDEVVWMVNSQRDSLRDFESYVCRYAENFLRASSVRCRLNCDVEIPEASFDLNIRRSLFLAIKEAFNNAVRHSGATEVSLDINVNDDNVRVAVSDNGKGFDFERRDTSRNGLSNMIKRMAEAGGTCKVVSQPGAGCRIELNTPLQHRPRFWRRLKLALSFNRTHETSL